MAVMFSPDPFVTATAGAGHLPNDVRAVVGYLGRSTYEEPDPGSGPPTAWWRIYLSLNFDRYIELSQNDIVFVQDLSASGKADGRIFWIKADARILAARTTTARDFLQGDITSRFLPEASATAPQAAPSAPVPPPSWRMPC